MLAKHGMGVQFSLDAPKEDEIMQLLNLTEWSQLSANDRQQWLIAQSQSSLANLLNIIITMLENTTIVDTKLAIMPKSDVINSAIAFTHDSLTEMELYVLNELISRDYNVIDLVLHRSVEERP